MLSIIPLQVKDALQKGYEEDLDPPLGPLAQYIKEEVSDEGYKHMMAVGKSVHLRPWCETARSEHLLQAKHRRKIK